MNRELKNLKIDPSNIKNRVKNTLNADLLERRMYMKYKIQKIAAIAASFAVVSAASAFAVTPTGQAAIENIISYFQDKRAVELTSYEELSKYNEEIGVSASNLGYTLTLDNVAADDNFIHVFFTLTSDEMPFYENGNTDKILGLARDFWEECKINGEYANTGNHNDSEGYFADTHTYKGVEKYNISGMNIPDNFKLEFILAYAPDFKSNDDVQKFIEENGKEIKLSVSADIDKSKVHVATVTKELNMPLWNENTIAEKLIFSPFGNQLVVKTKNGSSVEDSMPCTNFALFDENGTALDILNTDLCGSVDGESTNSFEFLKADANTKKLTFVPLSSKTQQDGVNVMYGEECERKKIGEYPIEFQLSEYGKVVVTDVRITDGRIEIDYYHDGFILYDPEFNILDENGKDHAELALKHDIRCLYDVKVHNRTNSYTATYQYYYYDEHDNEIPASKECNEEVLKKACTQLSLHKQDYLLLDYDNAITVDIK